METTTKTIEPTFQQKCNRVQSSLWSATMVISAIALAFSTVSYLRLISCLLKDFAAVLCRSVQLIQFTDFFAPGDFRYKFLNFIGRNFLAWTILPHTPNDYLATFLMLIWSVGEVVRYNYYLNKSRINGALRYNVFLVNFPLAMIFETISIMWTIWIAGMAPSWLNKRMAVVVMAVDAFVFWLCFTELMERRRMFYLKKDKGKRSE